MRAVAAQVQVLNDVPGHITVRAKAPGGRLNDAKPLCGFYGFRRRYAGETFKISTWQEFSPRWMEFVDPCPEDWKPYIAEREQDLATFIENAKRENAKSMKEQQLSTVFSMFQMQQRQSGAAGAELERLREENARLLAELDRATKPSLNKGK
jgi:hypothetical protein